MLEKLGFENEKICECIVATLNRDLTPNAAPMGIKMEDGLLIIKAHENTDTCINLLERKKCSINIVYDALLFLICAVKGKGKQSKEPELEEDFFDYEAGIPVLKNSLAYIIARAVDFRKIISEDSIGKKVIYKFMLKPEAIKLSHALPQAPNRAFFAAIEMAIEISRGRKENIEKNLEIIRKTSKREYEKIKKYMKKEGLLL